MLHKLENTMMVKAYNEYSEFVEEYFNADDSSVGIHSVDKLDHDIINDIEENIYPNNTMIYSDDETLVMKDNNYRIVIKKIKVAVESYWIVASITNLQ